MNSFVISITIIVSTTTYWQYDTEKKKGRYINQTVLSRSVSDHVLPQGLGLQPNLEMNKKISHFY